MELSKLSYSRENPDLTPRTSFHEGFKEVGNDASKEISSEGISCNLPEVSSSYRKDDGVLSTNLIFVLSGGEKREKNFLDVLIKQRYRCRSLRVVFMSMKNQGLQPYQMQEKWEEIQDKGGIKIDGQFFHIDELDKVYLLSDVDEFYSQLVDICTKKADKLCGGEWIISNPCFEIWLYYCYLNDPEKDLKDLKSLSLRKRSQKLKEIGNELIPGGLNPCLAFEHMRDGIKNSLMHYDVDENGIPILYATNMHELAEYIVKTMNRYDNEYDTLLKKKEEKRKIMKSK